MKYAEVALNNAVKQTFHYHVPPHLQPYVSWGHLVRVAFGTAMQPALVVDLHWELPPELEGIQTKPILEVLDPIPTMRDEYIELAAWMSQAYLSSPGAALWLMLPPGIIGKGTKDVHLLNAEAERENKLESKIIKRLREESPLDINTFKDLGVKAVNSALRKLEEDGIVHVESRLRPPSVSPKTVRTVQRAMPEDEVLSALASLKRSERQSRAFALIARHDYPLDVSEVYEAADVTSSDLNTLEKKGLVILGERIVYRDSLADRDFVPSYFPELTSEQAKVWAVLEGALVGKQKEGNDNPISPELNPTPTLPEFGEGVKSPLSETIERENYRVWKSSTSQWQKLKGLSRELRTNQTPAEDRLWQFVKNRKLNGHKVRRQQVLGPFVVDFYIPDVKLIIEIDGEVHQQQKDYDAQRTRYLEELGFELIRIENGEIFSNIKAVLTNLAQQIEIRIKNLQNSQDKKIKTFSKRRQQTPPPNSGEVGRGLDSEEVEVTKLLSTGELGRGLDSEGGSKHIRKFLLHGVTGSGKTEIYLRAIAETLMQGRQAIFLVPEIALTPQTIRRVAERFPEMVAVVHGSLSAGERYDTWRRARDGEIGVIVGTRSALFTPLPDIGLIILDEEHDHSYKHQPPFNPPYYHAREVAEQLADINDAFLILGSATPDMETYFRAQRGDLAYLHMPNRIVGHKQRLEKQAKQHHLRPAYEPLENEAMGIGLPPVSIVDMRAELRAGNRSMFSRKLKDALFDVLQSGHQAMLLLNRRGQASYVFCRDCGYVHNCSRCDMPMTYHRAGEALRCHHCGNQAEVPSICPNCMSERIRFFGAGTQQVELELYHEFAGIELVRWDRDTAEKPDEHEAILAKFARGDADVLVGTQMIAKGLDLPMVTLVGVISADPGLALPDFRANERAFQLLTQVAGRAGRGVLGGQVIIQTYQPEHPSILFASQHDYEGFYQQELEGRRSLGYPPFRRLGRVLIQAPNPIEAKKQAEEAAQMILHQIERQNLTETSLIGPAPSFFSKIDKLYRWQLLVRSQDPLTALSSIPIRQGWYVELDPVDIL